MDTIDCPRCEHEHDPLGTQEDAGEMECDECGFKFLVEIEYDPSYSTECFEHEWSDWMPATFHVNRPYRCCLHCGKLELEPNG